MKQKLLVVARRFWPLCDESCHRLLNWTSSLQQRGVEITVLTSRGHSSWPAESDCREIKLVRLLPAPKTSWTETLFLRNIAAWIVKHRREFDAIYVDESQALLHQIGSRHVCDELPIIARYAGIPQTVSNGLHALSLIAHAVDACRRATCVIAPNAMAHRQLQSSGIPAEKIARIPDVAMNTIPLSPENRRQAARALREVNQDMALSSDAKLLLYVGMIDSKANLGPLIKAAISRLDCNRNFRFWLVGDGGELRNLYDLVKHAACHHDILFHSPFDNLDELLQVADAVVCPEAGSGDEFILPSAIAVGIPIIAPETTAYRNVMPRLLHSQLFKEATQTQFESTIDDWLGDTSAWKRRAEDARREWVASNFVENTASRWLELLKQCG